MNMSLEVLISTCNDGIASAVQVPVEPCEGLSYLIVHQVFGQYSSVGHGAELTGLANRSDVRIIRTQTKGLAKSRNIALENAAADIVIFCDDDITLLPDIHSTVTNAFNSSYDPCAITFKIRTPSGEAYKRYRASAYEHTRITAMRVSSVEIAARRECVLSLGVTFDERFGLGTDLPACEENVFLADLIAKKQRVLFEPQFMVEHHADSSGSAWSSVSSIRVRGALVRRVYGFLGFPLLIAFGIKQHRNYRKNFSMLEFFRYSIAAFFKN